MTTKLIAVPKQDVRQKDVHQRVEPAECLAVFPEYPPRDDMNNPIYLHEPSHMRSLAIHFGRDETTFVMSEVPVSTTASIGREHRRPDLMVAFNCDRDLLIRQKGYATLTQGKPPDFVLEVASESTGSVDYTDKREEYAGYGIPEYWRFDPSGGNYHDAALAGDRLADGEYKRIEIEPLDGVNCRGYSAVLGLWLYWEDHQLRWLDPETGRYLRTHDEEYDRAELEAFARRQAELRVIHAETRAINAENRADLADARASQQAYERWQEAQARQQAENRAEQEAHARQQEAHARQQAENRANQAETRADHAETRADHAEAEIQRLRAQLDAIQRSAPPNDENQPKD